MAAPVWTMTTASYPRSRRPVRSQVSGRFHASDRTVRGNGSPAAAHPLGG